MGVYFKMVHITEIVSGDIIEHHGEIISVEKEFIKNCPFMGRTLYGDSYHLGTKLVKLASITRVTKVGEVKS